MIFSRIEGIKTVALAAMFLFFMIAVSCHAEGQTDKQAGVVTDQHSINLKKGNAAYKTKKYFLASVFYKYYIASHTNVPTSLWLKLADCYWQMRKYDDCMEAYGHVIQNSGHDMVYNFGYRVDGKHLVIHEGGLDISDKDKIRISELQARLGHYSEAGYWLKNIPNYQAKATAYTDSLQQVAMQVDSGCWKVNISTINTGYRTFSPFICDNTLLFSSNRPFTTRTKISEGDGMNFSKLWQIPLSDLSVDAKRGDSLRRMQPESPKINEKKLAHVFAGADNESTSLDDVNVIKISSYLQGEVLPGIAVGGLSDIHGNVGAISMDRNRHLYFSENYEKAKEVNHVRIMEGLYNGKAVNNIQALPFGDNNSYSVMHPAVNSEGTILVFSSDKSGGKGGFDLYYSRRDDHSQSWGEAKNLTALNTVGNEVFPCITDDGYLYFSSDGRPGFGGLDIYRIPLAEAIAGKDSVEHLPNPINSPADDFGWTQDSTGINGYFTSDRLNSTDNLYNFHYYPKMITIEGYVRDIKNGQPIADATVFVYDRSGGKVTVLKTDVNGKYSIKVKSDVLIRTVVNPYNEDIPGAKINDISDCLLVSKNKGNGYVVVSSNDNATKRLVNQNSKTDVVLQTPHDFLLNKFTVGMKWEVKNIYYDFDKWNIRGDAYPILDSLVSVLKAYPILQIELSSHTDSRGTTKYNQLLSQKRAESAVAYMVAKGIAPKRITAKGYGATQLLNQCAPGVPCTEEEHQKNRRTEVKIMGYSVSLKKTAVQSQEPQIDLTKHKAGEQLDLPSLPKNFFEPDSKKAGAEPVKKEETTAPQSTIPPRVSDKDSMVNSVDAFDSVLTVNDLSDAKITRSMKDESDRPVIQKINGRYVIQLGAFKSRWNATRLASKIRPVLPSGTFIYLLENENAIFRVKIGYFANYKEVSRMMKVIAGKLGT
jgi:outer membrane protein OmpA-like peptidoglycan-associated protein